MAAPGFEFYLLIKKRPGRLNPNLPGLKSENLSVWSIMARRKKRQVDLGSVNPLY
jgi:hypothetical protein